MVRPTARRIKDTAGAAYRAARQTGEQQLGELGLSREKGEETLRSLLKGVTDAAKAARLNAPLESALAERLILDLARTAADRQANPTRRA